MAKKTQDPGIGYSTQKGARQIINKDGSSNIIHVNRDSNINDLYSYLISISWTRFFLFIVTGYILLNVFFGLIYTFIGIEKIATSTGDLFKDFLNGFFFSAQTVTTVGYGGIAPKGIIAGFISSFEALIGLLSFSFITGLLYGRFSRPRAAVHFSENIVLRAFKDDRAIMFRLMNNRKSIMIEPEITVTLSISKKDKFGNFNRSFYNLELERKKIMYLTTIWTVVHEIDKESPLYELSNEEIKNLDAEIYILMQYHEESFSQKVYQLFSYHFSDIIANHKFMASSSFDTNGYVLLDHKTLNKTEPV